uniref:Uncharacterized protein n=1 Tax=Corethron hystrix TaxID=216773 RepID=A0A7S1FLT3_9STRA|mmetsp:Transcript_11482/g.25180  ORF Transcript_11482/g.25180 Transcript_11482/m.25180 type:complete len:415 (+) Transcript_11482:208-1452(+)|eukprot:CAMPEP_0113315562 /NCGR_PEP_ID=MMETSP0010_2-20120614/11184_1 /TAXON_ID=216773 ORGANISM="Corethron hystrix, Strain 308" /NCGR_SAMPLE_ID=MMETSP0010_2 /ASSEMBLY_ACC=CAM_ASM_000155 /LENGTH=414 /DNA_ID=CAMNT_0000172095 /DNA_START=92 /DNA_END=1336 /DNA_ORIENTATION=- /assembly_acc=CAM_ASM_000155
MSRFPSLESLAELDFSEREYSGGRQIDYSTTGNTETFDSTDGESRGNVDPVKSYDTGVLTNDTGGTSNTFGSRYSYITERAHKACCAKSARFCCCYVPLGYIPIITMLILISFVLSMIPVWYYGVCPTVIWSDELFAHLFESQAIAATNEAMRQNDDDLFDAGNEVIMIGDSNLKKWEKGENCGYDREYCSETVLPGSLNMAVEKSTCSALSFFTNDQVDEYGEVTMNSGYSKFLGNQTQGIRWAIISCGEQDIQFSQCGLFSFNGHSPEFAFNSFKSAATGILGSNASERARSYTSILFISTIRNPRSKAHHESFSKYDDLVRNYARSLASEKRKDSSYGETSAHSTPPVVYVDAARSFEKMGNSDEFYSDQSPGLSPIGYSYWSEWVYNALAEAAGGNNCVTWVSKMCTLRL